MTTSRKLSRDPKGLDETLAAKVVEQHFRFLTERHEFAHDGRFTFTSPELRIEIRLGHKTPRAYLYRIGEPEFTALILERVIQFLDGKLPEIHYEAHSLERNIELVSRLLIDHERQVLDHTDDWWLPAQVYQYRLMEQRYRAKDQIEDFRFSYKRDYDYLKSKGAIE